MRIAFDIGGVISKYPNQFRTLISRLLERGPTFFGCDVFVITDMQDHDKVYKLLCDNGFYMIPRENVHCADYETYGEGCKAELLRRLEIDLFFDDFLGYMMLPGDTIRCLIMPDPHKPYCHDSWRSNDKTDFGRRVYRKPWVHGSFIVSESLSTSTLDEEASTLVLPGRSGATPSPTKKARSRSSSSQKKKSSRATKRGSKNNRS
jgi:hypothetical protein